MRLLAIDPIGCGCTECIIGQYVPLDRATEAQIDAMIAGELRDNTGMSEYDFEQHLKSRDMV